MLMLAKGKHVATVQHPPSFRRTAMSFSTLAQKIKSHIVVFKGLAKDTEGASGIEYAIIAAMIAVVIGTFSTTISAAISATFTSILNAL
jgi:pilus assembly protein Flp/PilA